MGGKRDEAENIRTALFAIVGVSMDSPVEFDTMVFDRVIFWWLPDEEVALDADNIMGAELGIRGASCSWGFLSSPLIDLRARGFVVWKCGAEEIVGVSSRESKSRLEAKSPPREESSKLDQSPPPSPSPSDPLLAKESDSRGGAIGARTTGELGESSPDPELEECFN